MRIYKQDRDGKRIEIGLSDAMVALTETEIIEAFEKLRHRPSVCYAIGVDFMVFER